MAKLEVMKAEPVQGSMALWVATPFGLLMPAACPPEANQPDGTLQVRARDTDHLDQFRARWCPELGPTVKTPAFDYDCRAYVGADDMALAVARMVLAIDATKFKPLTDGPEGLKVRAKRNRLHDAYVGMWNAGAAHPPVPGVEQQQLHRA